MNLLPKITKITIEQFKKENEPYVTTTSIPYDPYYWKGCICYKWFWWDFKFPFKKFEIIADRIHILQKIKTNFLLEVIFYFKGYGELEDDNMEVYILKRKFIKK